MVSGYRFVFYLKLYVLWLPDAVHRECDDAFYHTHRSDETRHKNVEFMQCYAMHNINRNAKCHHMHTHTHFGSGTRHGSVEVQTKYASTVSIYKSLLAWHRSALLCKIKSRRIGTDSKRHMLLVVCIERRRDSSTSFLFACNSISFRSLEQFCRFVFLCEFWRLMSSPSIEVRYWYISLLTSCIKRRDSRAIDSSKMQMPEIRCFHSN